MLHIHLALTALHPPLKNLLQPLNVEPCRVTDYGPPLLPELIPRLFLV